MPRRYDSTAGAYRLTCQTPGCTSTALTRESGDYRNTRHDIDILTGAEVHSIFASRGERGGNSGVCRECQRRANRQRRSTGARVPGTTGTTVGENRRFGVELELIFPRHIGRSSIDSALQQAGLTGWRSRTDGSLSGGNGWEIVSPILSGDNGFEQIRTATRVLRGLGAKPNRSCGMHVHHEARDLTIQGFKNVARSWANNQAIIDGLVSGSRRNSQGYYCRALDSNDLSYIEACRDTRQLSNLSRYKTLNLASYGRHGTIEVRQHQGTCDAEKIISWVKFGQAIISAAVTRPTAIPTQRRVRDMLAEFGTHLNETARTFLLGRAVEFSSDSGVEV